MTLEANVSPAEETQNPAADLTPETPEVVTPENVEATAEEQAPAPEKVEESDLDRERKRFQRRMDRRTSELYQTRAERDQLAAQLAQLNQRPNEEAPPQQVDPERRAMEIAATHEFNRQCNTVFSQGSAKFPDFKQALDAVVAEVGPLVLDGNRPSPLLQVALESDQPAALLHYLGKNPDVAADLADLSPTQLARRLDRIERDMAAKPKVSAAPKPLSPVRASGSAVKDPSQMTDAEYRAWRLAQK